jgi:hypothetical protein
MVLQDRSTVSGMRKGIKKKQEEIIKQFASVLATDLFLSEFGSITKWHP